MTFVVLVTVVALVVGGVASVAGFGIGSVLTPLVATHHGMKLAVALVAIPHFAATLLRAWRLRRDVDRTVVVRFGIASAAGGLTGAILQNHVKSGGLAIVLGCLLVFAGLMGIAGFSKRLRFGRRTAWVAGVLSGGLGGLVGNQGGIRSAALMGFDVRKEAFVATATAIGVVVDLARLPVYLATQWREIFSEWSLVAVATAGTLAGTVVGERILRHIPERAFRTVVSLVILGLGVAMLGGVGRS